MFLTPNFAVAFFCPPRPGKPPSNNIVGTIEKIDEPGSAPVSLDAVRIWVDGTGHFTVANQKGYFFLTDIERDRIVLRFEYLGQRLYLDVGEVGWNNTITLENIVLGRGTTKYGKRSIQPFQIGKEG